MGNLRRDGQSRLLLQRLVDRDARLRSLRRGDNRELDVTRRVADDIDAGDARFTQVIGFDRSFSGELAPQSLGELGLLRLWTGDKHAPAFRRLAPTKTHARHPTALVVEAD